MQDEDGATVQVLLGENARVAGRDYVEISKLSVNDLKTLLTLLPRPIADDIVIRSAPAFHALYGFAADNSDEQRRQVVDIQEPHRLRRGPDQTSQVDGRAETDRPRRVSRAELRE